MSLELFHSDSFRSVMGGHIYDALVFLLENGQEFAIAAEVEHMTFEPQLDRDIVRGFGEVALFVLGGYTFESAHMDQGSLYFEAGFGENDTGTLVSVPFLAIKQIFVGEYPILINISSPTPFVSASETVDRSMEALLNNPENRKLIKTVKN